MTLRMMNTLVLRGGLTIVAALMLSTAGFAQEAEPLPDYEDIRSDPIDVEIPIEGDLPGDNSGEVIVIEDDGFVYVPPVEVEPGDEGDGSIIIDDGWIVDVPPEGDSGYVGGDGDGQTELGDEGGETVIDGDGSLIDDPVDVGEGGGGEADVTDPAGNGDDIVTMYGAWSLDRPIEGMAGDMSDCGGCEMMSAAAGGGEAMISAAPRSAARSAAMGSAVSRSDVVTNRPTAGQYAECVAENPGLAWLCNW